MRKHYLIFCLLLASIGGYAQQEAQYTQFMYNKLTLNPAYAGSLGAPCFSCIHRSQWLGFDGAPTSQVINFHMPAFSERVGLGASLSHDRIGPASSYNTSLMYAYRMKMGKGTLSIGARGTMRFYQVRWADIALTHTGDEDIPVENTNRVLPNFGVGTYYDTKRFFVGFSIPNLINSDLSYAHLDDNTDFGKERMHMYFMTGFVFNVSNSVKFKPAALVKYVSNAPVDLDLNATFIFMKKLWAGVSYRLGGDSNRGIGESIDLLVQYQISKAIRVGVAYDFTLSKLRNHSSGSVEGQLQFCLPGKSEGKRKENQRLTNPRFF